MLLTDKASRNSMKLCVSVNKTPPAVHGNCRHGLPVGFYWRLQNDVRRLTSFFYLVWGSYSTIFAFKNFANIQSFQFTLCGLLFQINQKLNHDILDLLNEPKIVRSCIFPIANLYFELSVDYVPESNPWNWLILWCICSDNPSSMGRLITGKK